MDIFVFFPFLFLFHLLSIYVSIYLFAWFARAFQHSFDRIYQMKSFQAAAMQFAACFQNWSIFSHCIRLNP